MFLVRACSVKQHFRHSHLCFYPNREKACDRIRKCALTKLEKCHSSMDQHTQDSCGWRRGDDLVFEEKEAGWETERSVAEVMIFRTRAELRWRRKDCRHVTILKKLKILLMVGDG